MTAQSVWIRAHDPSGAGWTPVRRCDASDWNSAKHNNGIFWTVNAFTGGVRRKDSLAQVRAWAIEIDGTSKAQQRERIAKSPLVPSLVVESKRGYHVYWYAHEATPHTWDSIMIERLVPHFGADTNARDLARLLRAPNFWHWKDAEDPFWVAITHHRPEYEYTERAMFEAFAHVPRKSKVVHDETKREYKAAGGTTGEDFWAAVYDLDCQEGLARLSGSAEVGGETFDFRRTGKGNKNILVNGKGTSCWIDSHGRIGSCAGGGPTLVQWLRYYGNDWKSTIAAIKRAFPHLEQIDGKKS